MIEAQPVAPVVDLDAVEVTYETRAAGHRKGVIRAVDGVSLSVHKGTSIGIVGESGSGKSTLARAMTRIVKPSAGSVRIAGVDVSNKPERDIRPLRRHLQMVFQDPYSSLNPRRTIRDTLLEPLAVHRLSSGRVADRRLDEVLESVGLSPSHGARYPYEFSGGQRQRVAIARALMSEPDVIVCDEPVSALDVSIQAQILRLLDDLRRELGVAYVFIAHDLAVVASITDEVVVLYAGRVVERGPTLSVLREPAHPYTVGLVASAPSSMLRQRSGGGGPAVDIRGEPPDPAQRRAGCRFSDRCWLRRSLGDPERCTSEQPELRQTDQERLVACHFASEVPVRIERSDAS